MMTTVMRRHSGRAVKGEDILQFVGHRVQGQFRSIGLCLNDDTMGSIIGALRAGEDFSTTTKKIVQLLIAHPNWFVGQGVSRARPRRQPRPRPSPPRRADSSSARRQSTGLTYFTEEHFFRLWHPLKGVAVYLRHDIRKGHEFFVPMQYICKGDELLKWRRDRGIDEGVFEAELFQVGDGPCAARMLLLCCSCTAHTHLRALVCC